MRATLRVPIVAVMALGLALSPQRATDSQPLSAPQKSTAVISPSGTTTRSTTVFYDFRNDRSQAIHQSGGATSETKGPAAAESVDEAAMNPQGWAPVTTETFEGVFPSTGWTVAGDPTWDDQYCRFYSGAWSAWCANGGTLGVDPCPGTIHYFNNMNAWMIYGPFDLSRALDARLTFYMWCDTEIDYDWNDCVSSIDGANWVGGGESGSSGGWVYRNVSLTGRAGQPAVWIAFRFTSDNSVTYPGVYLDQITIEQFIQPDLECFAPYGWPGPLVVSRTPVTIAQSSPRLVAGLPSYISWALVNSGGEVAAAMSSSRLMVISGPGSPFAINTWDLPALDPDYYTFVTSYTYAFPVAGTYTLELCGDYTGIVTESDEGNNCCQQVIVVSPCGCNCHCDPAQCDGKQDVLDVLQTMNVAFRGTAPIIDPNFGCPHEATDVDCSNATDVLDVTRMINVAFRGGNTATEFCVPCP